MINLRSEKEDLSRDLCEAQEKLKLQSKELKDALSQRKLAMSEYTEVIIIISQFSSTCHHHDGDHHPGC